MAESPQRGDQAWMRRRRPLARSINGPTFRDRASAEDKGYLWVSAVDRVLPASVRYSHSSAVGYGQFASQWFLGDISVKSTSDDLFIYLQF